MKDLQPHIRAMRPDSASELADLVCVSTNYWYETHGKPPIFTGGPAATDLFRQVYEDLDPGCTLVAEDLETGRLMGSCFVHPRETHVSLGIMNVHPNYFGRGVASKLLCWIIDFAEGEGKPVRLVSSAMNLDSFSLYSRAGFVPRQAYQDMLVAVPVGGFGDRAPATGGVRPATKDDVVAMADLEMDLCGIRREKDLAYFVDNARGIWHVSVHEDAAGRIDGFLVSVAHPGSNMLGPGAMVSDDVALALIAAELDVNRGRSPVLLAPVDRPAIVQGVYALGGLNCETHFHQVRGPWTPFRGVSMPTFMPETA